MYDTTMIILQCRIDDNINRTLHTSVTANLTTVYVSMS